MGTVSLSGQSYEIYGEFTDDSGATISATTYFNGSLNASAWSAATRDDQQKALIAATRIFNKQLWVGALTDPDTPQALAWPRTGVPECDGVTISTSVTPERVIFGAYELAGAILADATVQSASTTGSNTKRVLARKKVGDLEVEDETEYFSPTNIAGAANSGTRFPTAVQEYISCFIGGTTTGATVAGATASTFITSGFDFGTNGDGTL